MTEQIVVKLNKNKFKPLLDEFNRKFMKNTASSYSWLTGFALWYMHMFSLKKDPDFNNKTRMQWIIDKRNLNSDEALLIMMGRYTEFLKTRREKF